MEAFDETLQKAIDKLSEQEKAVAETKKFINSLCAFYGQPPRYASVDTPEEAASGAPLTGDEYYGKMAATAVRMVLERFKAAGKSPVSVDDIHRTLLDGGYQFKADGSKDGANQKTSLYVMLSKNTKTFTRINGKFGLVDWYDSIPKKKPKKGEGSEAAKEGPTDSKAPKAKKAKAEEEDEDEAV
jgi:hypothetical protein